MSPNMSGGASEESRSDVNHFLAKTHKETLHVAGIGDIPGSDMRRGGLRFPLLIVGLGSIEEGGVVLLLCESNFNDALGHASFRRT